MTRIRKNRPHHDVARPSADACHIATSAPKNADEIRTPSTAAAPPAVKTSVPEPAAPQALHLKFKEPPRGKLKRLMQELQKACQDEGMMLDQFLPALVARGQTADALRLLQYIGPADSTDALELDIWEAALLAAKGRHDDAHEALGRRGEATWSKYLEASQFLGEAHAQATLWLAQEAVRREPHASPALSHLALLYTILEDDDATLNTLARLAELEPLQAEFLLMRALCHMRQGAWNQARADTEALVATHPDCDEFHAMLAAVDAETGDLDAARKRCEAIGKRRLHTSIGVRWFIRAACKVGDDALLAQAVQHAMLGKYTEVDGYAQLMNAQTRRGNMHEALLVARLAARLIPDDALTHRMLGELLTAGGKHTEAARAFATAIACGLADSGLELLHADALCAAGLYREAGQAFRDILKQSPKWVPALRGMLAVLEGRGAPPREMIDWLHRGHLEQPDDVELARRFVVCAAELSNQVYRQRAKSTLERLHTLHPDSPLWRTLLAKMLAVSDPERALALAEGALASKPDDAHALGAAEASRAELRALHLKRAFTPQAIALPGRSASPRAATPLTFEMSTRVFTDGDSAPVIRTQQVCGVELGKTHENRTAVRTAEGATVWAPWSVCGGAPSVGAVAALKAGMAYAVPEGMAQRFATLLASPVVGVSTVDDFCRAIGKRGEAFLSGGAVRDIVADPHNAQPRDIDLVATLAPSLVRLICGHLAGDAPGIHGRPGGVVSPYKWEYFGLIKYGKVDSEAVVATLDIMSMRTHGALEPAQKIRGANSPVRPIAFGPDMHSDALFRDFTCNALYYDPATHTLLDPTGVGKIDAVQRRLQLCSMEHICKNERLGRRFIKMRQMGYTATEKTRQGLRQHFAHFMHQADAEAWLKRAFKNVLPDPHDADAWQAWYASATHILRSDDIGDDTLYEAIRAATAPASF